MTKQQELDDPASTWNRTAPDEPVFILCGRDATAVLTVIDWVDRASRHGAAVPKLSGAIHQAVEMLEWQAEHGSKIPD